MNGKNNSDKIVCDGIRVICEPDNEYSKAISNILSSETPSFPFEYYKVSFSKFSGEPYNGHNRPMRNIFVDNSTIGSEFAMCQYQRCIQINIVRRGKDIGEVRVSFFKEQL